MVLVYRVKSRLGCRHVELKCWLRGCNDFGAVWFVPLRIFKVVPIKMPPVGVKGFESLRWKTKSQRSAFNSVATLSGREFSQLKYIESNWRFALFTLVAFCFCAVHYAHSQTHTVIVAGSSTRTSIHCFA